MENDTTKLQKDLDLLKIQFSNHKHTGTDGQQVWFTNLFQKKMYITHTINDGSVTTNYGVFFIAPFSCTITGFSESHEIAGTNAGSVTLQLEKLIGNQAPGSGKTVLVNGNTSINGINLKGAINNPVFYPENVVQTGATHPNTLTQDITTNVRDINLKKGDRLALKVIGTPTSVSNISTLLELTYN
jgi:hypothetical protein